MTVLALWSQGDTQFLFGDVLLSADERASATPHVELPSAADTASILDGWDVRLTGLVQKVYLVSPTLCVGWAGIRVTGKTVIKALIAEFGGASPSASEVRAFLSSLGALRPPCTILGWVGAGRDAVGFRWESVGVPPPLRPPVTVGSGEHYVPELFETTMAGGPSDPLGAAVAKGARLVGKEVLEGSTLWNRFGGGIQLAYGRHGEFRLVESVTYLFMFAEMDDEGNIGFATHQRILKYGYSFPLMQALAATCREGSVGEGRMFYIPPVTANDGDVLQADSNMSLQSDFMCLYCSIAWPGHFRGELVACEEGGKEKLLKVETGPGTLERLAVSEAALREIVRAMNAAKANPQVLRPPLW